MVKRIISSLVVFCLVVGGISVLQAEGNNSVEQGAKSKEQKDNLKTQGSNLKAQSVKTVKIMNTKSKKMIEEVMNFTHPTGYDYITWSPDGNKVIYVLTDWGIPYGILMKDLKTGKVSDVTDFEQDVDKEPTEPDFSPDGKQIVCVIKGQVWKMDIDGKNKVQLTNFEKSHISLSPKWSPDGKKILLNIVSGYKLHFITSDGSKYITIPSLIGGGGGDWSPDGKKIVMIAGEKNYKHNLYTINIDDSKTVQLTTDGNVDPDYIPSWSPRDNKIAYTVYGDEKCPNYIMIINTDGSNPTKLLLPNNWIGFNPVWSKDGKKLLIVAMKDITHPLSKREPIYATGLYILTLPESVLK